MSDMVADSLGWWGGGQRWQLVGATVTKAHDEREEQGDSAR
jgi:hypothetical protein